MDASVATGGCSQCQCGGAGDRSTGAVAGAPITEMSFTRFIPARGIDGASIVPSIENQALMAEVASLRHSVKARSRGGGAHGGVCAC